MIFRHRDGELRIYDRQSATTGYYLTVLFTDANITFPIGRPKAEEVIVLDRGRSSNTACVALGVDNPSYDPMPFSFSSAIDDQGGTTSLLQLLSGATSVNGKTLFTAKGYSSLDIRGSAVSTFAFKDTSKMAYNVEVLWTAGASGVSHGFQIREIYFPPDQQTINEGMDFVTLNANGLIYGAVSRIMQFSSGTTVWAN